MPRTHLILFFLFPLFVFGQNDTVQQLPSADITEWKESWINENREDQLQVNVPDNPLLISTTQNLNFTPGITAFEGTAGTAKFSYRGMGARTQYSTSRSLLYLNEIPITSIQGFSSFEDLNPLWFKSFNLVWPLGESYPLALGGVLSYEARLPSANNTRKLYSEFNFGSFGLRQSNSYYSLSDAKLRLMAGYENTQSDGFRENNAAERESVFFNSQWKVTKNSSLKFLVYGLQNRVEIPSSLTRQDFEENPQQAAGSWGRTEGFKDYNRLITGLTFKSKLGGFRYQLTTFYRHLDNFEPRPFNILEEERHGAGLRLRFASSLFSFGKTGEVHLSGFGEYQLGSEVANTFENRFDSTTNSYNNKGQTLNETSLLGQRINTGVSFTTLFGKPDFRWEVRAGVNSFYQKNSFQDDSDFEYSLPFSLAPVLSVQKSFGSLRPFVKLYRSVSIPSLEENLDPDGSLNSKLKPELAWTTEIGVRGGRSSQEILLNAYYTEVQNLIVPRVVGPDQVVATNSGRSQHTGVEFLYSDDLSFGKNAWSLQPLISGYYGRFSYIQFSDTAGSFSGNELPGFPEWQVSSSTELNYNGENMAGIHLSFGLLGRYTSGYFVNDENTVATDPYFLLQSWLRAERTIGEHFTASANFGVRNLTDTHYASMTVVNNRAFGGGSPRFFYPGEPINWFGGISLSYNW